MDNEDIILCFCKHPEAGLVKSRLAKDLGNEHASVIYKTLLYKFSEEALEVLLGNPELMFQAKVLIKANRDAVLDVLDAYEGVIYNTDEIVVFLDAYAKEAPPALKSLSKMVKRHMLKKQKRGTNDSKGNSEKKRESGKS